MTRDSNNLWTYREGYSLMEYNTAHEYALEWMDEKTGPEAVTLTEFRCPSAGDAPDMFDGLLDWLEEKIREDERFHWDDGNAEIDHAPESSEGVNLRAALKAYIEAHIDHSRSAWIPTGVEEVLTRPMP